MRVSTSQIYDIANRGMRDAQAAINKTSEQMATGKRVLSPADDPVAAAQILTLREQISRTEQYTKNIDVAQNRLQLEETALSSITNLVQNVQELAVNAGNTATLTPSEYRIIASEVDTRIQELVNLQNTKDASGQYIFAGYQSESAAYVSDGAGFTYQGDDGSLALQVSDSVTIQTNDPGQKVFGDIATGDNAAKLYDPDAVAPTVAISDQQAFNQLDETSLSVTYDAGAGELQLTNTDGTSNDQIDSPVPYTPGDQVTVNGMDLTLPPGAADGDSFTVHVTDKERDLLDTMVKFRDALRNAEANPDSEAQLGKTVSATISTLDNAVTRIGEVQSEVGARLNTLESTRTLNEQTLLHTQGVLKDLQDLDYAEASTRLEMQELVLRATQQSFTKVSQLSLFNYL